MPRETSERNENHSVSFLRLSTRRLWRTNKNIFCRIPTTHWESPPNHHRRPRPRDRHRKRRRRRRKQTWCDSRELKVHDATFSQLVVFFQIQKHRLHQHHRGGRRPPPRPRPSPLPSTSTSSSAEEESASSAALAPSEGEGNSPSTPREKKAGGDTESPCSRCDNDARVWW